MKNHHGQGLVEYLILVCLIAVSAIAIVSAVGTNIREQYANISAAIRGKSGVHLTDPDAASYQPRGMSDFPEASRGQSRGGF
jgi:Flp pilus assembly pilin Flp